MPPTMAMMTEVIAEMTASMARPMAEMIEPYKGSTRSVRKLAANNNDQS